MQGLAGQDISHVLVQHIERGLVETDAVSAVYFEVGRLDLEEVLELDV